MIVTYEDAKKAAASIRKAVDPCSVVLFGSVAREGSGNDLDLLILIDDRERNIEDAGSLVQNSLKPFYKMKSCSSTVYTGDAILRKRACCPWGPRHGKKQKKQ